MNRIICFSLVIGIILTTFIFDHHETVSFHVRASTDTAAEPWNQWRGSVQHFGTFNDSTPSEGNLRWSFQTSDQVQSSPVFYEGIILIGSDDGRLYALDAETGEMMWKFTTGGAVQATPLILDGRVYFGSSDGFFYCLDLPEQNDAVAEPTEVWKYQCGGPIVSSAHEFGNTLLFGCHDGSFYKLSPDGDLLWKVNIGWEIWASPLIDASNSRAFIGATNGNFSAIDLIEDRILWTIDAGEVYSSGCLGNGTVYLCSGGPHEFSAINPDNGSVIWTFDMGLPAYSTPSYHQDLLYFTSYEQVWCLPETDPNRDGIISETEMIWSTDIHDAEGGSSPLLAVGKLFVGSDDDNLYCLDMETGTILWNFTTEGYVYSSPALYNNSIFFGSCDGSVYCIGNRLLGLNVEIETQSREMYSNETQVITITVVDQNGTVVEGAIVEIILSAGEFEVIGRDSQSEGDHMISDFAGKVEVLLKPPPVSSRSTIEIEIRAEKAGMKPGESTIIITVQPGSDTDLDSPSGSVSDLHEKRIPYYIIFSVVIIIDVVLALGIMKSRNMESERDVREDVKD